MARQSGLRGKKRPHHKSRRGCLACKRRRVKCDEKVPCSNCLKREEKCVPAAGYTSKDSSPPRALSSSFGISDDTSVNLLHLELFHHFQRDLASTFRFPEIWQQVLPWSFQESYLMHTILCLAATHLSSLRPREPRYSHAALQLLGKATPLFSERLSSPITAQNSEALIAASILMQYIAWSYPGFPNDQEQVDISADPLFRLSSGLRGIFAETFPALWGSGSSFITTTLYTPKIAIAEAIRQQGQDPRRFVPQFMEIWDDPRYRSTYSSSSQETRTEPFTTPLWCPQPCKNYAQLADLSPQHVSDLQRAAFARIAERLSLLFCLVSMSVSTESPPPESLQNIQSDIERCCFTFPVLYSSVFPGSALQHDMRALVVLGHFYRATRILLTGPAAWWARQRNRNSGPAILRQLRSRGMDASLQREVWNYVDVE